MSEQRERILELHKASTEFWAAAWESGESADWTAAFESEADFTAALDELIAS